MKRIFMTLRCRVIKLGTTHLYKNTNSYAQRGIKELCSEEEKIPLSSQRRTEVSLAGWCQPEALPVQWLLWAGR